MQMKSNLIQYILLVGMYGVFSLAHAGQPDAESLVRDSFDYYRGKASVATIEMLIKRPEWERTQVMKAWTRGEDESLMTVLEPSKDKGNGSLKVGRTMWTYNPKVKRTIKLPPSMMAQSWMGSDFSNNDLAKADTIINDYTHQLIGEEVVDGVVVYIVESIPKPDAPVIWGKEILKIREDLIYLEEAFYDEDGNLVKTLSFSEIEDIDGKLYPTRMVMQKESRPDAYTQIDYREIHFLNKLPDRIFKKTSLKNPPRD